MTPPPTATIKTGCYTPYAIYSATLRIFEPNISIVYNVPDLYYFTHFYQLVLKPPQSLCSSAHRNTRLFSIPDCKNRYAPP